MRTSIDGSLRFRAIGVGPSHQGHSLNAAVPPSARRLLVGVELIKELGRRTTATARVTQTAPTVLAGIATPPILTGRCKPRLRKASSSSLRSGRAAFPRGLLQGLPTTYELAQFCLGPSQLFQQLCIGLFLLVLKSFQDQIGGLARVLEIGRVAVRDIGRPLRAAGPGVVGNASALR